MVVASGVDQGAEADVESVARRLPGLELGLRGSTLGGAPGTGRGSQVSARGLDTRVPHPRVNIYKTTASSCPDLCLDSFPVRNCGLGQLGLRGGTAGGPANGRRVSLSLGSWNSEDKGPWVLFLARALFLACGAPSCCPLWRGSQSFPPCRDAPLYLMTTSDGPSP